MKDSQSSTPGEALAAQITNELVFGQVLIRREQTGFELRHVADRDRDAQELRFVGASELRALAQFTAKGAFRPLKSAPNLPAGWRSSQTDDLKLGFALDQLYPGAAADWLAAQSPQPPVTSYRDFTARQTGMYRITAALPDAPASAAVRACCHNDFCLKRRLWTVADLPTDSPSAKSVIPCLEPCAVMLEFARKIARLEQGVDNAKAGPHTASTEIRECDFDDPNNPRRLRFVLEKQREPVKSAEE